MVETISQFMSKGIFMHVSKTLDLKLPAKEINQRDILRCAEHECEHFVNADWNDEASGCNKSITFLKLQSAIDNE